MKAIAQTIRLIIPLVLMPVSSQAGAIAFTNPIGMKFIAVSPGTFFMGSHFKGTTIKKAKNDEKPHRVTLSKGFYLSQTEVTQGQWVALMGTNPSSFKGQGMDFPVESISWYECQLFITKLNNRENTKSYRLPTEAEWEYACRAGSTTELTNGRLTHFGCQLDPLLDLVGWYCANSGQRAPIASNPPQRVAVFDLTPHPVAHKKANAWGFYDMHGNVQEWVQDACQWRNPLTGMVGVITDTYRDGILDPVSMKGSRRIFRGGSWNQGAVHCRSSNRSYYDPKAKRNNLGFRIARSR